MSETTAAAPEVARVGRYRWVICGLLFLAVVINYVDRQLLGVLKPFISKDLGWSETNYADIVFYFQAAYAVSYLLFGAFVDRVGAKIGYAVAFIIWQAAHIAHAGARELSHFFIVRMVLGAGEAGNFPAGIKAVTEWFPKKERALATGIFNAGSNIGAIITPLAAPIIMTLWGWQMAFIVTGVIGSLWLVAWLTIYREPAKHPKVGAAELAYIQQDPADQDEKAGWLKVLGKRETWAFALGKFLIDPVWWMLLFWLPDFFKKTFELDIATFGLVLAAVYLISDVGSVAGGWMSSQLMRMGRSINFARKMTMLFWALAALPYLFITQIHNLWAATAVVGLVAAAHQAFSANLYTLPGDIFPRKAVGSVIGIGGMLGGIGGMVMAKSVGHVLEGLGGYGPIFAVAGTIYLLALLVIHLLSPKLATVTV
ncbi:ACS family hexuronate transporter-like MFS transporter [Caulobacter ginsengisoli]|uniref:ACS family hexuronate transporter-like MFS transporter n=1 Tax=Caulobacter ginsengisoli TaxID=400775 RepID=A0ABU0IRU9_9CAUL|nr:MFS transporter [Caulobacter ginsengisoli]MDQ0463667.1 ACS family hexuronate transporter-like MFS transporter [Caulobacter ginsengisoli]